MATLRPARTIPVARPCFGADAEQVLIDVLRSGWIGQGPRVAEFEKCFCDYVGSAHAVAVSSCTTALHLALMSTGIGFGDEVLCPSLSFIATANAIVHAGATPVFVDIDPDTYNLDPARIEESITPRTRAIVLVHQLGLPAPLDEILAIAARHHLVVVEDAACALGSEYKGRRIGAPHGRLACFSFHPRKIVTTGEGGMLTTDDAELAARLRRLRQHAMSVSDLSRHQAERVIIESYDEVGYNYRMSDLQAALGVSQLRRIDEFITRRRHLAARYSSALKRWDWLRLPTAPRGCRHNLQSYIVRMTEDAPLGRNDLMQALLERGISTRIGVMAIHRQAPYQDVHWEERLPQTNNATDQTLILPLFHQMTEEQQDYVVESIEEIGQQAATRGMKRAA